MSKKSHTFKRNDPVEVLMQDGSWQPGTVRNGDPINGRILVLVNGVHYGALVAKTRHLAPAPESTPDPVGPSLAEAESTAPESPKKSGKKS